MPRQAQRPCRYPGCPKLTTDTSGYCEDHKRKVSRDYERTRGTSTERGYDAHWRKVRKVKLATNPLCERCGSLATLVHHQDRNPKNNLYDNLEALCVSCHEAEHKHERYEPRATKSCCCVVRR